MVEGRPWRCDCLDAKRIADASTLTKLADTDGVLHEQVRAQVRERTEFSSRESLCTRNLQALDSAAPGGSLCEGVCS